jgi:hypothetical protein
VGVDQIDWGRAVVPIGYALARAHLKNLAALEIELTEDEFQALR